VSQPKRQQPGERLLPFSRYSNPAMNFRRRQDAGTEEIIQEACPQRSSQMWHALTPVQARVGEPPPLLCISSGVQSQSTKEGDSTPGQAKSKVGFLQVLPVQEAPQNSDGQLTSEMVVAGPREDQLRPGALGDSINLPVLKSQA